MEAERTTRKEWAEREHRRQRECVNGKILKPSHYEKKKGIMEPFYMTLISFTIETKQNYYGYALLLFIFVMMTRMICIIIEQTRKPANQVN